MISKDCKIHNSVKITSPVNLYGCTLKKDVFVGPFVEIQKDALIDEGTRVQSHTFICSEVTVGKNCFIGHGVMFINDTFSNNSINFSGPYEKTIIENNVIIGSNATILPVVLWASLKVNFSSFTSQSAISVAVI